MRYIFILFTLLACSHSLSAQIQAKQIRVDSTAANPRPRDTLYLIGNDTTTGSSTYGLGKWYNADSLVSALAGGVGGPIPINDLLLADGNNTINNANYNQEWQWNTLSSGSGLKLSSTSTAAASSTQKLFHVDLSGANGTASQTTYAGYFSNGHSGSGATRNYGLYSLVNNGSSTSVAVYGNGDYAIGVMGETTSGTGLYATATSGKGIFSAVTTGSGAEIQTTSGLPLQLTSNSATTSSIENMIRMYRNSSGTVADGIGAALQFNIETSTSAVESNTINSRWTTSTHASRVSELYFNGINAGTTNTLFSLSGSGQATLNQYTTSNFNGGAAADSVLVITSTGVIKKRDSADFGGGGSATDLTIGGAGPTYTIESSTGTDVTIAAGGINALSESPANTLVITATEVDGSVTNEIQDITITGASQPFTFDLSDDATDATLTGAGILTFTRSGNAITGTATEVDGSTTNELNTIEEGNVSVQTGNSNIDFQSMFDVATDGAGEANISLDLSEASTVTTPESDDWVIMHDAGIPQHQKILWSDLASLVGGADGNGIYGGDGTTPSDVDVTVTDSIEFNSTLKIINDANDYVGIGAQAPEGKLHIRNSTGSDLVIEESGGTVLAKTKANSGGVEAPMQLQVFNRDVNIDISGDFYQMGNITFSKASATTPGGAINFNVGYDSLNLDGVLQIASRETGATDGIVKVVGGLRYKWTTSGSSTYTLNTGDMGLTMTVTGAKTATIPDAVTGIIGQVFQIFNSATSGDITIAITGGSGDTIYGDPTLLINESAIVTCVAVNKWIINN